MRKTYLKIIVLLVFIVGGLGCVRGGKNTTDSGLTSITVSSGMLADAIKKKIDNPPLKTGSQEEKVNLAGLSIVGVQLVVAGYTHNENINLDRAFVCYDPPQKEYPNSAGCNIDKTSYDGNLISMNIAIPPQKTNESEPKAESAKGDGKTEEITQDTPQKNLSTMTINYDSTLNYYGYLVFYCTAPEAGKEYAKALCIQNTTLAGEGVKPASYDKENNKLTLEIPLQWSKKFGGKGDDESIMIRAVGEVGKKVDVEIKPTFNEEQDSKEQ